ncbi:protein kinase domain-containing protein [Pseudomonas fluorescens]
MKTMDDEQHDEFHNVHHLAIELGRGAQGQVWRTRDKDVAIKLMLSSELPVTDPQLREAYARKIRRLRSLPIPAGLPLAGPAALLTSVAGYAMNLLEDMQPFQRLLPDAARSAGMCASQVPHWLQDLFAKDPAAAARLVHYRESGALRRRLAVLGRCAAVLARLHAGGLVYGDLSPGNVFLSVQPGDVHVWLIDADNLRFVSRHATDACYTPRYGAPEVVQGRAGSDFSTDSHALATLVFYLLSLQHPFIGDLVETSDWAVDDSEEDAEAQALAGKLPWIDDPLDPRNATRNGLPRQLVLTPALQWLCQQTFGAGRTEPRRRPASLHWSQALARAQDACVHCTECGMDHFVGAWPACPYCTAPLPAVFSCRAWQWPGAPGEQPLWTLHHELPEPGEVLDLPARLFQPFTLDTQPQPWLRFVRLGEDYLLEPAQVLEFPLEFALPHRHEGAFRPFAACRFSRAELAEGFFLFVPGPLARLVHCTLQELEA